MKLPPDTDRPVPSDAEWHTFDPKPIAGCGENCTHRGNGHIAAKPDLFGITVQRSPLRPLGPPTPSQWKPLPARGKNRKRRIK